MPLLVPPVRWKARGSTATLPLHAIADRLTPTMRRQFLEAIALAKGRIDIQALASAFDSRSYVRVAQVLEQANLSQDLGPILRTVDRVFSAATAYTATELSSALGVPYGFDLTNPRAVAFLERYHLRLIREVDQGTREGIRQILLESFNDGIPPLKAARRIREIVGLTERQSAAVANYERALLDGGLGARAATAKADKYAAQLLKVRSEAIARTEAIRASAEGQQEAWKDAANRGVLDRETTWRVWIVADDDRLCDLCAPMADQEVRLDEPFTTGDGSIVMTPPAHVQCRCSTGISRVGSGQRRPQAAMQTTVADSGFTPASRNRVETFTSDLQAETDRLSRTFPTLSGRRGSVDATLMNTDRLILDGKKSNALGAYSNGQIQIAFSEAAAARADTLALGGFTVSDSPVGVFRHELGHHVQDRVLTASQRREWLGLWRQYGTTDLPGQVSRYAASSYDEWFAESFAAYTHPSYRGGLPSPVDSFLGKALKKKGAR